MATYIPPTNIPVGEQEFYDPVGGFELNPQKLRVYDRAVDVTFTTGLDPNVVVENPEQGIDAAKQAIGSPTQQAIDSAASSQEDLEQAAPRVQETLEKEREVKNYSDYVLEDSLTVGNPAYNPTLARTMANQQVLVQMIEERMQESGEPGLAGKALDFIDRYFIRYLPFGMWEDITKSSERTGRDVAAAAATMEREEFMEWAETWIDNVAAEGLFREENFFAFQEAVGEATNSGYDPNANINQLLALGDAVGVAGGFARIARSTSAVSRVATHAGADAAAEAVEVAENSGLRADESILTDSMPRQLRPEDGPVSVPNASSVYDIMRENKLLREIQTLTAHGTFGRPAAPEEIALAAQDVANDIKAISSNPIVSVDTIPTVLNNYDIDIRLGQVKGGASYAREATAQKRAAELQDKGFAAGVVEAEGGGWYVQVRQQLDLATAASPAQLENSLNGFQLSVARALGSTSQVDDPLLDTLALQAEGGVSAIREAAGPYIRQLQSLPYESKQTIGQIFTDLRDGVDSATRSYYTETEFIDKFKQISGKAPTQKDIDAYYAAQTISDASYILQANRIAKRYVSRGYKTVDTGVEFVPARPIDSVGADVPVFHAGTGRSMLRSSLPAEAQIWRTDRPLEGGIEHVFNPRTVRSIQPQDVLNYNAGGRRMNPDTNYFVTAQDGLRAMLGTFSEAQARAAVSQLNEIFDAVKRTGKHVDELTDELDEVLVRNNDWNPDIDTTGKFVELASRKGWDLSDSVSFKKRDGLVEGNELDLFEGMTYEDALMSRMHRSDDVLMDFGGKEVFNYSPVSAIVDQLSSASIEYAFQNYTMRAKTAWLKRALQPKDGKLPSNLSINRAFEQTDVSGRVNARQLEAMRSIIKRRELYKGSAVRAMEEYGQQLAEFVFNKTGAKLNLGDPTNIMLRLGFQSAFGFGNIFQFFLQASHAMVMAAISPRAGLTATAHVIPIRIALQAGSKEGARRLAKTMGVSPEDMDELFTIIKTSGREMVEADAVEKGTGAGFGLSGWEGASWMPSALRKTLYQGTKIGSKAAHVGTLPFREGERLSRLTGIVTAFLEYKNKYAGASALTDSARSWITRREQDLSFNMTSASRAAWQDGLMRMPTQWLSYSLRAFENMLLGRNFTKAERIRLGLFFAAQGGLAGMGLSSFADYIAEGTDMDPAGNSYVAMKYGFVDGVLSWALQEATDEEIRTAIGTRISPLSTLFEIYRKVTEESAASVLGGPSTEIVYGGLKGVMDAVGQLYNGYGHSSLNSMERALRTPSGIDNIYKAMGMYNDGTYESKTGRRLDGAVFSDYEATLQLMGVTNFKVAEYYNRSTMAYRNSKQVKSFLKQVSQEYNNAVDMINEGEIEAGKEYIQELDARIRMSGFSPYDQQQIRRSLRQDTQIETIMMQLNLLKRDNIFGVEVVGTMD